MRVCVRLPLLVAVLAGGACTGQGSVGRGQGPHREAGFSYNVSWIGNSYGGGPTADPTKSYWVSYGAGDIDVHPSGWLVTNNMWDEGSRESGFYDGAADSDSQARAGRILQGEYTGLHGWARHGGYAVATGDAYTYVGMMQGPFNASGYPSRDTWYAVRRYNRTSGIPAPFPSGVGYDRSMLVLSINASSLTGMALDEVAHRLYVSNANASEVVAVDVAAMRVAHRFKTPFPPGKLALGPDKGLWVATMTDYAGSQWPFRALGAAQPRVVAMTTDGQLLPWVVNDTGVIGDVHVDGPGRRLVVADNGRAQQVVFYPLPPAGPSGAPTATRALRRAATVGELGGVFNASGAVFRGAMGPLRFYGLEGVGMDASGDLFVALCGLRGGKEWSHGGLDLRKLRLDAASGEWRVVWSLQGLEFVDSGYVDPHLFAGPTRAALQAEQNTTVYTQWHVYTVNLSLPEGRQWELMAYTMDPSRYGEVDPRANPADVTTVFMRHVNGIRLMWSTDMYSKYLTVYRFETGNSFVAVPCAIWHRDQRDGDWPAAAPPGSMWHWADANGDGRFQPAEFTVLGPADENLWGLYVADGSGDVWLTSQANQSLLYRATGFDAHRCPTYNLTAAVNYTGPPDPPLNRIERQIFDPVSDVMWMAGYSAQYPWPHGEWKLCGRVAVRYDDWSARPIGEHEPSLQVVLPHENGSGVVVPTPIASAQALTVVDELLFVVTSSTATVYVYTTATGDLLGTMHADASLGNFSGWVDTPYGISAAHLDDGRYLVLAEEDGREKLIMYTLRLSGPVDSAV